MWRAPAKTHKVGRLIYFQTALCYGTKPREQPITLDHPIDPVNSSYAISKTAGEHYIQFSGVDWVTFRLANVVGPRNVSGPLPIFFDRLSQGKRCFVTEARRDFVFVDDLARIVLRAADGTGSGTYHFSSGRDVAIKELYDAVVRAMKLNEYPAAGDPAARSGRGADHPARSVAHLRRFRRNPLHPARRDRCQVRRLLPRARRAGRLYASAQRASIREHRNSPTRTVLVVGGAGFVGSASGPPPACRGARRSCHRRQSSVRRSQQCAGACRGRFPARLDRRRPHPGGAAARPRLRVSPRLLSRQSIVDPRPASPITRTTR